MPLTSPVPDQEKVHRQILARQIRETEGGSQFSEVDVARATEFAQAAQKKNPWLNWGNAADLGILHVKEK